MVVRAQRPSRKNATSPLRLRKAADRGAVTSALSNRRGGVGNDDLRGESGDDSLNGGPGNDSLTGGAGRDGLRGGPGRDRIRARDGRRDRVTCGSGPTP